MENLNQARPISNFRHISSVILGGISASAWAGRMICNIPISAGAAFGGAATVCNILASQIFGPQRPNGRSPESRSWDNWCALLNVVILSGSGDLASSATGVNLTGAQIAILTVAACLGANAVGNLLRPQREGVPLNAPADRPEGVRERAHSH